MKEIEKKISGLANNQNVLREKTRNIEGKLRETKEQQKIDNKEVTSKLEVINQTIKLQNEKIEAIQEANKYKLDLRLLLDQDKLELDPKQQKEILDTKINTLVSQLALMQKHNPIKREILLTYLAKKGEVSLTKLKKLAEISEQVIKAMKEN